MKKKINYKLMQIATIAIMATLVLLVAVFYNLLKKQVMEDLRIYSKILQQFDLNDFTASKGEEAKEGDLRITLIEADGVVLYDNMADVSKMENHKNRKEIKEALNNGEGSAVRKSATLSKNTFYYAVLLPDGTILRVAKEANSILHICLQVMPLVIFVILGLWILCVLISRFLTKTLIRPIEQIAENMDHMNEIPIYEELIPFIKTIDQQHKDILKNANIRQEFTANVSHELKTPLTSISGYSELIESGMASEKDVMRFAKEIHRNSNRLLTLINDIIRLSELDASSESSAFEQVNLYEAARTCVEMLQMNASRHHVSIELNGKTAMVYGNKQMLDEVLFNLCDNAIRYNVENGKVVVTVDEEDDTVFLSVKDTGIGISEEHQERIFERFYRVDKSRSKKTGGTGLGLAIVKHIVALHHATLKLSSKKRGNGN